MSQQEPVAERRRAKDLLTSSHQWVTLILLPVATAAILWAASAFDGMRQGYVRMDEHLGAIDRELSQHETRIGGLEQTVFRSPGGQLGNPFR